MRVLMTERCVFDKNHQPITVGKLLLQAFSQSGMVTLLAGNGDRTRMDLITHHLDDERHQVAIAESDSLLSVPENIAKFRGMGRFDLVVDSDPSVITWAYSQGLNCLLALEPKFMDPRFRPDGGGVASWAQMVDEIESQTRMLAEKRQAWEKSGFNSWE